MKLSTLLAGILCVATTSLGGIVGCNNASPSSPMSDGSQQEAYAKGNNGKNDGGCVSYTVATGCTRTQGYWRNHSDWPCPYTPGAPICQKTQVTFWEGLNTSPGGNAYWILAQQYVPALLNKSSNIGNIPAEIQAIIDEAQLFFRGRFPDAPMTDAERARAIEMARILDEFNNGLRGLPHCN